MSSNLIYSEHVIKDKVQNMAVSLNTMLDSPIHKNILFVGIMNGCMFFMSDLLKQFTHECSITTVKAKSYVNNERGDLDIDFRTFEKMDLNERTIVLIDEFIDSGKTIDAFIQKTIQYTSNTRIVVVSLLVRYQETLVRLSDQYPQVQFLVGDEVGNDSFLYGYGLDLNGKKRNLKAIYYV